MDELKKFETIGQRILDGGCASYYARKIGRGHIANDTICQDYCLVENIDFHTQVVCVADGHGGREYSKSDVGARFACEIFYEMVREICSKSRDRTNSWLYILSSKNFKKDYIDRWQKAVLNHYKRFENVTDESDKCIVNKYGTTFLFAVYDDDGLVLGQLGDGAILLSDEKGKHQLFKRHGQKLSSATNSLASNRAEYAFHTDVYPRGMFQHILLSTDGIYDRLDGEESFYLYQQELVRQIKTNGKLIAPYSVIDIDISELSRDDCTIALMLMDSEDVSEKDGFEDELLELEYTNLSFFRKLQGLIIYKGEKNGKCYEIHITEMSDLSYRDSESSLPVMAELDSFALKNGKMAYVYEIPETWSRVGELIEYGEHLEKRYCFNRDETEEDDDDFDIYSNEYWLNVYEQVTDLRNCIKSLEMDTANYYCECLFVKEDNTAVILSDAILMDGVKEGGDMNSFFDRFSIIGKLTFEMITIPLFASNYCGQSIDMLHCLPEKRKFYRVVFNMKKKIFGLHNESNNNWILENGKTIPPNGVLKLNENCSFFIKSTENEKISPDCDSGNGSAKYEVTFWGRNMGK